MNSAASQLLLYDCILIAVHFISIFILKGQCKLTQPPRKLKVDLLLIDLFTKMVGMSLKMTGQMKMALYEI